SLRNASGYMVMVYLGPCTIVGAQLCHLFTAVHTNLVTQSVILLMMSFGYRLWVLEKAPTEQKQSRIWPLAQVIIALLAMLNSCAFYLGGSYDVPNFSEDHPYGALQLSGLLTANLLASMPLFTLLFITMIGSVSIVVIRRRLANRIRSMRSADRHAHHMIYRSLMAQMTLPVAYILAFLIWILDLLGIVRSHTLQRVILMASSFFALASPLINMHYIPPYRK
ncbi:hypothetical protein PENTCL1PPCAC_8734, partial [Pristionchus entomophagus]